MNLSQFKPFK